MPLKTIDQMTDAELAAWRPETVDMATIRAMVGRLVSVAAPERIVLFGSHARGRATPESDVDLLVITDEAGEGAQRAAPYYAALADYLVAVDIVVVTPAEVAEYQALPGSLVWRALREGVVLYARG